MGIDKRSNGKLNRQSGWYSQLALSLPFRFGFSNALLHFLPDKEGQ